MTAALTFTPEYHREVRSHTGPIWYPVSGAASAAIADECARLVNEGRVVICHATTPPGVGKWPRGALWVLLGSLGVTGVLSWLSWH